MVVGATLAAGAATGSSTTGTSATGAAGAGPARALMISPFSRSAWVPKMAWTLLPTSTTPAAPSAFSRPLSTFPVSPTSIRSRVMQASTCFRFSRPPKAAISCSALWLPPAAVPVAAPPSSVRFAACSASKSASGCRPGVRRFHFTMTNRNSR